MPRGPRRRPSAPPVGRCRRQAPTAPSYSLSIPAGALPSDTALTLTPLASISGAPFAQAHGVQIAPDGLHPLIVPTLTVTPKASVPAAKRAVFTFDGAGGEFHLYPASTVFGGFALPVARLGGYGFGLATFATRSRFAASHPPTAVIDQLAQALGVGKASATTARAAGGPASVFPSSPVDALILASAANIESLLAGGTVASLDAALVNYTTWQAIAGSQVSGTPEVAVLDARIRTAISAAAHSDAAIARVNCFATKDLNSLAGLLTMHAYAMARGDIDFGLPAVDSAIDACMRFTVSYEAEVNESLGAEVTGDIVVDSKDQPVTLTPGGEYASTYLLRGLAPAERHQLRLLRLPVRQARRDGNAADIGLDNDQAHALAGLRQIRPRPTQRDRLPRHRR